MFKYKFLIKPGPVMSIHDGDIHNISFTDLVRLYNLHPQQCIDISKRNYTATWNAIILEPDATGEYSIAEAVDRHIEFIYKPKAQASAILDFKKSYNKMKIIDKIWLLFKGYKL